MPIAKSGKPTKIQYALRIKDLMKYYLKVNGSRKLMLQYASKKWGIGDRAIDDMVSVIKKDLKDVYSPEHAGNLLNLQLAKLQRLMDKAEANEDSRLVLEIMKEQSKLMALYEKHNNQKAPIVIPIQTVRT